MFHLNSLCLSLSLSVSLSFSVSVSLCLCLSLSSLFSLHFYSNRLLLGFMCVTAFLSMWISNTATAAMMLPIAQAVLQEISEHSSQDETDTGGGGGEAGTRNYSENVQLVSARRQQHSYNSTGSSEEEKEDEIKESPIDVKDESITEDNNEYTDDRQEIERYRMITMN